tara:strand:- start:215 stop:499 length:285 start_codon:yes stop_codon:yes gene_type:complete
MKKTIRIKESQYNRIWLLRRYDLVKDSFEETVDTINPCKFKSFDEYERRFANLMMDELHPVYYLIDDFNYEGIMSELKDMFYVELTELYWERKC